MDDTKTQHSTCIKTKLITPHTRYVHQFNPDGTFVAEFESVTSAGLSVGLSRHSISAVCRGKNKTCAGYIWKYKQLKKVSMPSNAIIISEYPNYYVSEEGKIYSCNQTIYLKPQINKNGYCYVTLCKDGSKQNFYIHRLVAQAFIENCDEKDFVNHKDLDKTNNNLSNLEWVTHSENIIHMYEEKEKEKEREKENKII